MQEIWIKLTRSKYSHSPNTVIAISNTGLLKRLNGSIEVIPMRMRIGYPPKPIYRILMEYFKPKTEEDIALGRDQVDHITHSPTDININDIRNLRWCTAKENSSFSEARNNKHKGLLGKKFTEEHKLKLSIAHKGKKFTEEHKLKLSIAHKGKLRNQ